MNDRLLDRIKPTVGDRVLDIGCGTGALTMDCAVHVGDVGSVTGLDISDVLLARASKRRQHERVAQAEFLLADAQTHPFEPEAFDKVISRFGTMFFSDPVAAFTNMKTALRPGGRLTIVAWAPMADNPWFRIPHDAAVARLGKPSPVADNAPGPLAFQDTDYVLQILRDAGWADVTADVETVQFRHPGSIADVARSCKQYRTQRPHRQGVQWGTG